MNSIQITFAMALSAVSLLTFPNISYAQSAPQGSVLSKEAARTLATFWSMDTERKTPYNIRMVSSTTVGDYKTDRFYLTSQPFETGKPDQVLCTFSRNVKQGVVSPVYIDVGGGADAASVAQAPHYLHCAVMNIEWRATNLDVRSRWANTNNNNPWTIKPHVTDCFVFPYVQATRRVMDYLSEQPEIDKTRVGVGGASFGGWFALLIAGIDNRVTSVFDLWGCGGQKERHGWHNAVISKLPSDEQEAWLSHYDPNTFLPNIKASTMIMLGTNELISGLRL